MLRYSDLTPEQKKKICNGCGGKGGIINPPEFMFHASCNHHDFLYWRGNTEKSRKLADESFYRAMRKDVSNLPWYRKPLAHLAAYTYYKAVRISGKKFFYYADKQRTIEDLK